MAVINWMGPWDDVIHNYFLWQQSNGKWSMMPWDLDAVMSNTSASIFAGSGTGGVNYFKDSFIAAFRSEFKERMWWLIHTVLHPDNVAMVLGPRSPQATWAKTRFTNVYAQCGLGVFRRPNRPLNQLPAHGQAVGPFAWLQTSPYSYNTNPAVPHLSTTWTIRTTNGSYYAPIFQITSSNNLTSLPIPFGQLKLGETYFWQCTYADANGHPSLASAETAFTFSATVQSGAVVLNEIMANNLSTITNGGQYPDWIELHNPSTLPQQLDGMSLTDDLRDPAKFVFPANTIIPPRGYLVVWCDRAWNAPGLHTGFGLDAHGETVGLFSPSANSHVLKDVIGYGIQAPDLPIGRSPDASGRWTLNRPTPMAPNQSKYLGAPTRLKINEWMANPSAGDDWFELFNPETEPVALGGLCLTDDLQSPAKSPIPSNSYIAAGGYVTFLADGNPSQGGDHTNFRLNAEGSSLGLFQTNRTAIDIIMFGAQVLDVAQGRLPDGAPAIFAFGPMATPGGSNCLDQDRDGLPDAWEWANYLDPNDSATAISDADGDGLNNLQEYLSSTDPHNPHVSLKAQEVQHPNVGHGSFAFQFMAAAGRSYMVEYCESLSTGYWQMLTKVNAQATTRLVEIRDPARGISCRFYRIVLDQ
jgi:hypothetical protein